MSLQTAEQLLFSTFRDVPFHSLYFYYNKRPTTFRCGGSCSDKVLHAFDLFNQNGFDVHLHSSYIREVECHKMLRLVIDDLVYFADVGNAWPAVKLFPADREISYSSYGILFYTKLSEGRVNVFQQRDGESEESVSIPIQSKAEDIIAKDIECRFEKSYPFDWDIRFAQIIDDKFLFLRETDLYTYTASGIEIESGITAEKLPEYLKDRFNFDLDYCVMNIE
jgi:hypothetical protein